MEDLARELEMTRDIGTDGEKMSERDCITANSRIKDPFWSGIYAGKDHRYCDTKLQERVLNDSELKA